MAVRFGAVLGVDSSWWWFVGIATAFVVCVAVMVVVVFVVVGSCCCDVTSVTFVLLFYSAAIIYFGTKSSADNVIASVRFVTVNGHSCVLKVSEMNSMMCTYLIVKLSKTFSLYYLC